MTRVRYFIQSRHTSCRIAQRLMPPYEVSKALFDLVAQERSVWAFKSHLEPVDLDR